MAVRKEGEMKANRTESSGAGKYSTTLTIPIPLSARVVLKISSEAQKVTETSGFMSEVIAM